MIKTMRLDSGAPGSDQVSSETIAQLLIGGKNESVE
jgi:hypothetical protein